MNFASTDANQGRYVVRMLKVKHYGDYLTELSSKYVKEVIISYLSLMDNNSYMILHVMPSRRDLLRKAVDLATTFSDVKVAEAFAGGTGFQHFAFIIKRNYGVLRALHETKSMKIGPVSVENGRKSFLILTPRNAVARLVKLVKKYSPTDVEVMLTRPKPYMVRPVEQPLTTARCAPSAAAAPALTERELRVLLLAYEFGYFSIPRKTDLSNLSRMLGISKSTVLEHLRKAERKVIKYFIKRYLGSA